MELKSDSAGNILNPDTVLIIPYGIEISCIHPDIPCISVLIIPYGIEIVF